MEKDCQACGQPCLPPCSTVNPSCLSGSHWGSLFLPAGFSHGMRGKEPACQCRRCGFHPWSGRFPWRRKWQPTQVFLAWRMPRTEEPKGLQPIGSQRIGHDWVTKHRIHLKKKIYIYTHTHTHTHISQTKHPECWWQLKIREESCHWAQLLVRNNYLCSTLKQAGISETPEKSIDPLTTHLNR